MTARRKAAGIALTGLAPLALTALTATPAVAHGSMTDPVSRISACFAEGPEHPKSAACKAMVAAGGTQALYDWNGVRDGNAGGQSRKRIPDGKLCSANSPEYKGLDLPRADWPSTNLKAGDHTFRYKATAPHRGTFELYVTKDGYDPAKPLKWSDLETKPFAKVTNPTLANGDYVFGGKVPAKSGRHLIYSIWQRSDSPEAFYTCSDVVFGKGGGTGKGAAAAAPSAAAPSDRQIAADADKSSMDHMHHGGHGTHGGSPAAGDDAKAAGDGTAGNAARPNGGAAKEVDPAQAGDRQAAGSHLAETGGDSSTAPMAIGGAAVLAVGASVLFASTRRKAARQRG
ncbi:chitin-binding protein [Streptomyces sp. CB02923]|uniref:lytic polysaccharide monooxygenase n=1 Tax=Streptomyces sp. CB02923 TaxID=1718985 RepID=UPI00093E20F5|nr:lytic polysaccharide monooxygenase [Streptomyces sp. CB02923]OKH98476.1 chitin-binding protein [Streptomyces sp. CB02923]